METHTIINPNHFHDFNEEFELLYVAFSMAQSVWIPERVSVTIDSLLSLFRALGSTGLDCV
jgi:hypothetical protein